MFIYFRSIRFKNFLSYGNYFSEIKFDDSHTAILIGDSGSGKSTVQDALSFVLFGKAFRPINKSQLINATNGKECLVELDFSVGSNEYIIRRGIKPNIFEIIKNGNPIDQVSSSNDQQEFLETNILKTNYKTFCQTVALGIVNYTPFMTMKASERRNLVEDILSIQIFSTMHGLLKEKVSENKLLLNSTASESTNINNLILEQKKRINSIKSQRESYISTLQNDIESNKNKIKAKREVIDGLLNELDILEKQKNSEFSSETTHKMNEKQQQAIDLKAEMNIKIKNAHANIDSLKLPYCSKCKTEFDKTKIKLEKSNLVESKLDIEKDIEKTEEDINNLPKERIDRDDLNNKIKDLSLEINTLSIKLKTNKEHISLHNQGKCPTCRRDFGDDSKAEIIRLQEECSGLLESIDLYKKDISDIEEVLKLDSEISKEESLLSDRLKTLYKKISSINQQLQLIEKKTGCDVCKDIDIDSISNKILKYQSEINELSKLEKEASKILDQASDYLNRQANNLKEINSKKAALSTENQLVESYNETLKSSKKKLKEMSENIPELEEVFSELKANQERLESLSQTTFKLTENARIFSIANDLLKDTGIKSLIVDTYIPIINHFVNKYLAAMNFAIIFELDKNFEEKIQSRGVDVLTYSSMSEGERQRLDIAILLTWRTIAMMKNSVNCNLMFVDEILDCSLDQSTTENIIDLLSLDPTLKDSNLMVISHKPTLADKFEKCLRFEKGLDGFSRIKGDNE